MNFSLVEKPKNNLLSNNKKRKKNNTLKKKKKIKLDILTEKRSILKTQYKPYIYKRIIYYI